MEELLVKIGELITMEIDEVVSVEYPFKELGFLSLLTLKDGRKVILNLIEDPDLK